MGGQAGLGMSGNGVDPIIEVLAEHEVPVDQPPLPVRLGNRGASRTAPLSRRH